MNIHVARTPHFRTRFTHTCCQGQTGSLTVRPDTARCEYKAIRPELQLDSNRLRYNYTDMTLLHSELDTKFTARYYSIVVIHTNTNV